MVWHLTSFAVFYVNWVSIHYMNPHYKIEIVCRPSQVYSGNPYSNKTMPFCSFVVNKGPGLADNSGHARDCGFPGVKGTRLWASCQIVELRVAHVPGMSSTYSPSPRFSNSDMHHDTGVTHVP